MYVDDRESAVSAAKSALAGQSEFDAIFRVAHRDGEVRHVKGLAGVIHDENGRPLRMIGVNYDVTTQCSAEAALLRTNALLDEFIRHAPAAIAMLDVDFCYVKTSHRWLHDYGLDDREIIGRNHFEFFPYTMARWEEAFRGVLRGAVEREPEELVTLSHGRREWIEWEARPWRNAAGAISGVVVFSQVITRKKELAAALERQKKHLENSNQDLEQFAYAASHDLQEPLRAISGCAQLLKKNHTSNLTPAETELIGHIVAGTERMRALVSDLLAFSRVGAQERPVNWLETNAAVGMALNALRTSIEESSAVVQVGDLPRVQGDINQIALLFQNLISNAIKYCKETPQVVVSGWATDQGWEFSVADNGIGIDKKYHDRIFQLFGRLHTRQEFSGSGVGLAICQRIVSRLDGRIWVESEPGSGSTFRFFVPKVEEGAR